jgi:hypothetical protein
MAKKIASSRWMESREPVILSNSSRAQRCSRHVLLLIKYCEGVSQLTEQLCDRKLAEKGGNSFSQILFVGVFSDAYNLIVDCTRLKPSVFLMDEFIHLFIHFFGQIDLSVR